MLALKNCRLIPELTEGYDDTLADLVLDGEVIAEICKPGTAPSSGESLDLGGRTVIPGMFDLHCHLHATNPSFLQLQHKPLGTCCFDAYHYARTMLRYGFTTLRDMGSNGRCGIYLRNAINKGQVEGPRITSCGLIVGPTESGSDLFTLLHNDADGPDEMLKHAREEMQAGSDFVKSSVTGGFLNEGGVPGQSILTREELDALVTAARLKNRYVAVHCHGAEGIKMSLAAGVRTVEHAALIDDEGIEMLKNAKDQYAVLTMTVFASMPETIKRNDKSEKTQKAKQYFPIMQESLTRAYKAGLKLGWGTDTLLPAFLARPASEFLARRDLLGMSNIDMLLQATKYSAEIVGALDRTGTVKAGKYADLAVFDGNPDEDILLMDRPAWAVFKGGKRYD